MFSEKKSFYTLYEVSMLIRILVGCQKFLEVKDFNKMLRLVLVAEWLNSLERALYGSLNMLNWKILQKTHQNVMQKLTILGM